MSVRATGPNCTVREGRVVLLLLLCGGDKDSQERDIRKAKEMAAELD